MKSTKKSIAIFGAGKIGRSFIGQLFSLSGYEVIFIDIDQRIINELNKRKKYEVVIKSEKEEVLQIANVSGINANNQELAIKVIANCSLMATCVGKNALPRILPLVAKGIEKRFAKQPDLPLDIILAENIRDASTLMKDGLSALLDKKFPIDTYIGLIETSIGKMVPIMPKEIEDKDPLLVYAEPYNTLILDKNGFKDTIPKITGLSPKENIKAWVDRKLFIHNLGHATAAYLGFQKNQKWVYIYEALENSEIFWITRQTMLQSADILMGLYLEEFTWSQLETHIDDLLERFKNKALGDTIFRVGCDLYRKLSPEDRLAGPIHAAIKLEKPFNLILNALISGIAFRAKDENGNYYLTDEIFFSEAKKGKDYILENISKLIL